MLSKLVNFAILGLSEDNQFNSKFNKIAFVLNAS